MKIAITGLTGFLGHYIAKKLFEMDVHIQSLIRDSSNVLHLQDYQKKITFHKGDLTDKETLKKFVQGADVVIHMAYERRGATFHEAANRDIKHGCNVEVSEGGKVVYVGDVVQAIVLAIGNKEAAGKIYNLVDFYVDNMCIARMAKDICASKSNISGTPKHPINTIDNTQSKSLGARYTGNNGK